MLPISTYPPRQYNGTYKLRLQVGTYPPGYTLAELLLHTGFLVKI